MNADFVARMDSDDISVSQRIETQINFMLRNPTTDIVGSNILIFNDAMRSLTSSKIISHPTIDSLIKFNMLFHCCLAHPTVVFRMSTLAEKLRYNTQDPDVRAFEDYELWMRLIQSQNAPKFANIGVALLLYRKHGANTSQGAAIENEIPMKVNILTNYYLRNEMIEAVQHNPQIVGEFIKVTGRPARSDTFSNLKQKRELSKIFDQVSARYKE